MIVGLLDTPLFTGTSQGMADGPYDVFLAGHGYMLDLDPTEVIYGVSSHFHHRTIPFTRPQFSNAQNFGESTVNQDDLWRRAQESWHLGAGQTYVDREDSIAFRYRASQGVDVWTRWQATLLHDTGIKLTSAGTVLGLAVAGGYIYVTDAKVLKYTADITAGTPTWTSVTGNPDVVAASVCSDGNNIYTAYVASGIYKTTRGTSSQSSFVTGTVSLVRYVKGRLMAASGASMYNPTGAGALPAATFTHPNSDFTWVDFAEGPDYIYAAGYSGDKSLIYKTQIRADASALDPPTVAGELPDGEIVYAIQGYLGFLLIGTARGVRVGQIQASGAIVIGPLLDISTPVRCFEPQGQFCWFGWSQYAALATGLGRLDLSQEVAPGQPPYATDLMAATTGNVLAAVTFQNIRVFSVSGIGVYAELPAYVTSGTLTSGKIAYGVPDNKTAIKVATETAPLVGTYRIGLAANDGTSTDLGTISNTGGTLGELAANETQGRRLELQLTLLSSAAGAGSPTFYRMTLFSDPTSALNQIINVPLLIHEDLVLHGGSSASLDVASELEFLSSLRESRQIVPYVEGSTSYTVVLQDYRWIAYGPTRDDTAWNGTLVAELKTIS